VALLAYFLWPAIF